MFGIGMGQMTSTLFYRPKLDLYDPGQITVIGQVFIRLQYEKMSPS